MPLDDQFRFSLPTYDANDADRMSETLRELEHRFNDLPMFRNPYVFATQTDITGTNWTTIASVAFNTRYAGQVVTFLASIQSLTIAGAASKGEYRVATDLTRSDSWSSQRAVSNDGFMVSWHWFTEPINAGPHIAYLQARPETAASTVRFFSSSKLTVLHFF